MLSLSIKQKRYTGSKQFTSILFNGENAAEGLYGYALSAMDTIQLNNGVRLSYLVSLASPSDASDIRLLQNIDFGVGFYLRLNSKFTISA